jgi:RNase P subunit RPR2
MICPLCESKLDIVAQFQVKEEGKRKPKMPTAYLCKACGYSKKVEYYM